MYYSFTFSLRLKFLKWLLLVLKKKHRGLVCEPLQNTPGKGANEAAPACLLQSARLHPPTRGPGLTLLCRDPRGLAGARGQELEAVWGRPASRAAGRRAVCVCVGGYTPASKSIPEDPSAPEEQGWDCTGRPGAPGAAGAKASQTPTPSSCNLLALVLRSLIEIMSPKLGKWWVSNRRNSEALRFSPLGSLSPADPFEHLETRLLLYRHWESPS